MTFSPLVGDVLRRSRGRIESLMVSTCLITTPGTPVRNNETGVYEPGEPVEVYSGKCRLRWPNPAPQDGSAGQGSYSVDRVGTLSLPMSVTVPAGARAVLTVNPEDPAFVGVEMKVLIPHGQTHATARRLPVQIVTRDAGYTPAVAP